MRTCFLLPLLAVALANMRPALTVAHADDILNQARARYAALKSYADTGTVVNEYGPGRGQVIADRHTFSTFYRAPRHFFFEFRKAGGERFVIWSEGREFNTWWSSTKVHETYAQGRGTLAFALAAQPTKNSALQIPALIFSAAGLHGPIESLQQPQTAGMEDISGHRCHKITGRVAMAYGTGYTGAAVPTTVWIDAESLLVRKVFEDTAAGAPGINRMTTTFEPQANPQLDDSRFRFAVPNDK